MLSLINKTRSLFRLFWAFAGVHFAFHSHELACYVFAASFFAVLWKLVALLLPRCWAESTDSKAVRNPLCKRRLSTFPKHGWNASNCHEVHPLIVHPSLSLNQSKLWQWIHFLETVLKKVFDRGARYKELIFQSHGHIL